MILALVGDARVFRLLYFNFEVPELIGQPVRSLRGGLVFAAVVLFHVSGDVGVNRAGGQLRICGFETHIHQTAVRNAPYAEAAQECGEFGRASLVRKVAAGNGFGKAARPPELGTQGQTIVADGLQGQRFAGQDFCLRLNVIVRIDHIVVRVGTWKRKYVGVFAVDFNAGRGHVNRTHAEGGEADDRNNREQEGENQPLVLSKDEQIIVKVRLPGRQIQGDKAVRDGHQFDVAV